MRPCDRCSNQQQASWTGLECLDISLQRQRHCSLYWRRWTTFSRRITGWKQQDWTVSFPLTDKLCESKMVVVTKATIWWLSLNDVAPCNQKKADTWIFVHASCSRCNIKVKDTDVVCTAIPTAPCPSMILDSFWTRSQCSMDSSSWIIFSNRLRESQWISLPLLDTHVYWCVCFPREGWWNLHGRHGMFVKRFLKPSPDSATVPLGF